jgi:hypothetical protein
MDAAPSSLAFRDRTLEDVLALTILNDPPRETFAAELPDRIAVAPACYVWQGLAGPTVPELVPLGSITWDDLQADRETALVSLHGLVDRTGQARKRAYRTCVDCGVKTEPSTSSAPARRSVWAAPGKPRRRLLTAATADTVQRKDRGPIIKTNKALLESPCKN